MQQIKTTKLYTKFPRPKMTKKAFFSTNQKKFKRCQNDQKFIKTQGL
jgi:hypothetical protein